MDRSITHLDEIVDNLSEGDRKRFYTIFSFWKRTGRLTVPDTFMEKVYGYCRGKERGETQEQTAARVSDQIIIKTLDKYLEQQALFNELRTTTPGTSKEKLEDKRRKVEEHIEECRGEDKCDFCALEKYTSFDLPRITKGKCKSGGNLAKYDSANGMIYFWEHNPLRISRQELSDCIDVAEEWFKQIHDRDSELVYPFLGWNCLERAGASQIGAHMHALLTQGMAYEGVEKLRRASERYKNDCHSDYFAGLFSVHKSLGLGFNYKNNPDKKVMVSLTPKKDKDTWIMGSSLNDLKEPVYEAIECFKNKLEVFAFNLAFQMPPLIQQPGWEEFPYIARMVDRGDPLKLGTDIAIMEMFGTSVVGSDPFKVAKILREYMES